MHRYHHLIRSIAKQSFTGLAATLYTTLTGFSSYFALWESSFILCDRIHGMNSQWTFSASSFRRVIKECAGLHEHERLKPILLEDFDILNATTDQLGMIHLMDGTTS